jgi:putative hydrolase of HD superfamily
MDLQRWEKQLNFILEVDKLKSIYRRTYLITDIERLENDAEHTWHLTLIALLILEYTNQKNLDLLKVLKMLIIHDIVEIRAGDTYCYDVLGNKDKAQREKEAADDLFSLLPEDQHAEMHQLWKEYEEQKTPEAKYSAVIDRIQPLLLIYFTQGRTWIRHGINLEQELKRNEILGDVTPDLWEYAQKIIYDSAKKGFLKT